MSITLEAIYSELQAIRAALPLSAAAAAPSGKPSKAPKAKRVPKEGVEAKPNRWFTFTARVRALLDTPEHKLGLECSQFCSDLKAENANYDEWSDDLIRARFAGWTRPEKSKHALAVERGEVKPKDKKNKKSSASDAGSDAASESTAASSTKSGRKWSAETKAAAAAKRAATKAAKAAAAGTAPASAPVAPAAPVAAPAPAVVAPPPSPAQEAEQDDDEMEWTPLSIKKGAHKGNYLHNEENGYCYKMNKDGSRGAWAGVYDADTKEIDDSIPEPEEDEFVLDA